MNLGLSLKWGRFTNDREEEKQARHNQNDTFAINYIYGICERARKKNRRKRRNIHILKTIYYLVTVSLF